MQASYLYLPFRLFPPPATPPILCGVLFPDAEPIAGAGSASAPPASIFEILHTPISPNAKIVVGGLFTHDPMKSIFCIPCIFFLVSAMSFAISGSISTLAYTAFRQNPCYLRGRGGRTMIFGMASIITALKSIISTMGFFSMPRMFIPPGTVK